MRAGRVGAEEPTRVERDEREYAEEKREGVERVNVHLVGRKMTVKSLRKLDRSEEGSDLGKIEDEQTRRPDQCRARLLPRSILKPEVWTFE